MPSFNYLMLSDVHLGSDIVPHLRPWAQTSWLTREAEVDAHLVGLLDHYASSGDPERPWRLVIAGDFLDLVGVSIKPDPDALRTPATREEELHGLGSAPDHVVQKVRAIAARHPRVFRAMQQFIHAGHSIVLVRGNHDVELHWRAAQRAFVDAIVSYGPPEERAELASGITICPWFFAVEGLLYVEHGHEFDGMCSYGDPLLPLCERDPRRIQSTPFSVLLRHVARPTRGLSTSAYGYVGMAAYGSLVRKLGARDSVRIARRFARASFRLVGDCFAPRADQQRRRALSASVRRRQFIMRMGVTPERVAALAALYTVPAARSLRFVIRSLYLDRAACLLLALAWVTVAAFAAHYHGVMASMLCALPAAVTGGYACIGSGSNTAPNERMREGARSIANLFKARWVVMGHTHEPRIDDLGANASYVNLGSWGEDELPDERTPHHQSPCTFLVLRHQRGDYGAELMRWDPDHGPLPFCPPSQIQDDAKEGSSPTGAVQIA